MELGVAIDGGGIGGIGPAVFIGRIGNKFTPSFGAGTSIGSAVIAAWAVGHNATDLPALIHSKAPTIFCDPGMAWKLDPRKPRYSARGLEKGLKDILGASTRISDTRFPVFIAVHDWVFNRLKVYDFTDSELLWEAVAASCSAPTWFPPRHGLADGGTIANNPSMVAITGAMSKLRIPLDRLALLSLGTNGDYWKNPEIGTNTSKVGWASILLENPCRGNEMAATFQAQTILASHYHRVEPILSSDYKLDAIGFMAEYGRIWDCIYDLRIDEFKAFMARVGRSELV